MKVIASLPFMFLVACGPASDGAISSTGEPVDAPPRLEATDTSCPRVVGLSDRDGAVQAVIWEQSESHATLGRTVWTNGAWQTLETLSRAPFHSGSLEVDVAPGGDVFAAFYVQAGGPEFPELFRTAEGVWAPLPMDMGLDESRQNFPGVVALDPERVVLSIGESGGGGISRQHAYLREGGFWTTLEENLGPTVSRSFHRGPQGQVWRARYDEEAGALAFHEWSGQEWVALDLTIAAASRAWVSEVLPHGDEIFAVVSSFDEQDQQQVRLFALGAPSEEIPLPPAGDARVVFVKLDAEGAPVVTLSGTDPAGRIAMRTHRAVNGGWTQVHELSFPSEEELDVTMALVGPELFVALTRPNQDIHPTFEHHTDCALRFERAPL